MNPCASDTHKTAVGLLLVVTGARVGEPVRVVVRTVAIPKGGIWYEKSIPKATHCRAGPAPVSHEDGYEHSWHAQMWLRGVVVILSGQAGVQPSRMPCFALDDN